MTITVVETYEEDSHIAVARHIASLLDEGQVGAPETLWRCCWQLIEVVIIYYIV
jgi:hypothetical protein